MQRVLTDLSPEALAGAIEASTMAYYAHYSRLSGTVLHDEPPIRWFATGIAEEMLNGVLQARLEPQTADAQIEEALAYFRQRQLPMLWHTGPSTRPADLGTYLLAHGLAHVEDEPGMAIDLLAVNEPEAPPGLSVAPVLDVAALREWIDVWLFSPGLGEVRERFLAVFAGLGLEPQRALRHYLGRLDGRPVATVALFCGAGVASVQHVVTLPAFLRRGIGAAMTQLALREARALGYRVAVLTASPMGYNVYYRLGFRQYCTLGTYSLAHAL
jgi:GNAT superfamily N-acetyltransferase